VDCGEGRGPLDLPARDIHPPDEIVMRLLLTLMMMALTGTLAACAGGPRPLRGPAPLEWRALVGCYRLTQGPATWSFALDSAAERTEAEGARIARSFVPRPEAVREHWLVTERNTVLYVKHEGWGTSMEFVVRGDSLVGMHYMHTDVVGWEPRTPAAAVREPCPAGGV
jgi:hypothetical protein